MKMIYCPSDTGNHCSHETAITVYMYYSMYQTQAQLKRRLGTAFMRLALSLVVIRQHASASFRRA